MEIGAKHGGDVYAAARDLGKPVDKLLDFSASINPLGPSAKVFRVLAKGRAWLSHYPDPDCWALKEALAAQWGLAPTQLAVGNGSTELIDLLPRALGLRRALIIGPTFSEYACAVARVGGRSTMLFARRSEGYRPPVERAIARIRAMRKSRPLDAIFLCNPNSPTGQPCDPKDVLAIAWEAESRGLWMIVDESFAEYCEEVSVLPRLAECRRMIVLRSFTKFHALPGIRIGYAVAPETVVRRVMRHQPPWAVNTFAQLAAEAALSDRQHAARSLRFVEKERERFLARLSLVPGLNRFPSAANFVLLELPRPRQAGWLTQALRRRGILIRDCSGMRGLNRRTVRVAIRTRRDNDRLVEMLTTLLE